MESVLEISFKDKNIKDLCLVQALAVKKLGPKTARKLRARISDIEAADSVEELVAGGPHPLTGDRQGEFSLTLHGGFRLTFKSTKPIPLNEDGSINWFAVTDVIIWFIGDYHG